MKSECKLPTWAIILVLVALSLIVLSTPFLVRSAQGNDSLIGTDSYLHLGLAQNIEKPGSYPLPQVQTNVFHSIAAFLLGSPVLVAKLLPIILAVATSILSFFLFLRLGLNKRLSALSSVMLILSPLFIVIHTSFNPFSLFLFLLVLSAFAYTFNEKLGAVVVLTTLAVDAQAFILSSLALLCLAVIHKKIKWTAIGFGFGLCISAILFVTKNIIFHSMNLATSQSDFFVSLGSGFGFSIFILALAFIGGAELFRRTNRRIIVLILLLAMFLYSLYDPLTRIIILLASAIFAAQGLMSLLERNWTVQSIKYVTLFLIILCVLFTSVMTISARIESQPSLDKMHALNFLKTSLDDDVILSSQENGVLIERVSRRTAFIDVISSKENIERAQTLFYAQRVKEILPIIREVGITHILIDRDMLDGGVWTHKEQGLLFMLENNDRFVEVYNKGDVSIYRVVNSQDTSNTP